ncbi:TPA: hypothetical protein I8271_005138 [Kluyvera intermedia]|uniref:Uncharacterized protein n=1 Tax=Kluyvera intermedia TaxID=61648 RepID=A0A9P3TCM4_KLUIN|nr:hypothetical protein [Phytobacter ursingii]HAT2207584.1 hypothetical protein [Kluyvera intermedia]HAT2518246.1 hypothetical protein [Kluyvera intermedia]HAT2606327.1 hypothetical protein [Kluyvera intermedia]HAT2683137.1 hypothetical protein [Kluyvera intermedia]HAT2699684.1 hypothetical protein [Kluyvera intermedia]
MPEFIYPAGASLSRATYQRNRNIEPYPGSGVYAAIRGNNTPRQHNTRNIEA